MHIDGVARAVNWKGFPYMPLQLKKTLIDHGISQVDWCSAIRQHNGKPISRTVGTRLLNFDWWPKRSTPEVIKEQTKKLLESHGVSSKEIARIWMVDEQDTARKQTPVGRRFTKAKSSERARIKPMEYEAMTPEARAHFRIDEDVDPFAADIQKASDVFMSASHRKVRTAMFTTAKNGGIIAVASRSGAGKSVIKREFLDRIQVRKEAKVRIIQPLHPKRSALTSDHLVKSIIQDLRPGVRMKNDGEMRMRQAKDILIESLQSGSKNCIFIEEAHRLPIPIFWELKSFWELELGLQKMLSIVLIGQPALRDILDESIHPEIVEFIRRCELVDLAPLDNELEKYVEFKFKRIGKSLDDIFEKDALGALRERLVYFEREHDKKPVSDLYPLSVHIAITKAMNNCAKYQIPKITADVLRGL